MKIKPTLTVLAVAIATVAQPTLANWTYDKNGEPTHYKGIPVDPIPTVEQARAATEKRIAAIKAEEAKQAAEAAASGNRQFFYTGKPYLEETGQYLFLFRHYDPELSRWSTADPSGFPDGANNWLYVANIAVHVVDSDGLEFLHFDGSKITVYSGSGYQSNGSINWGTAGISWTATSGGGGSPIPNGWYKTSGPMTLGGIEPDHFPEKSVREGNILFAGTMSSWDRRGGIGYGNYAFNAYNDTMRFGYDTSSGGTEPTIVEYKIGLAGIHGNSVSLSDGFRIHPTMAGITSGCIGITSYGGAVSFGRYITSHIGIELLVGRSVE